MRQYWCKSAHANIIHEKMAGRSQVQLYCLHSVVVLGVVPSKHYKAVITFCLPLQCMQAVMASGTMHSRVRLCSLLPRALPRSRRQLRRWQPQHVNMLLTASLPPHIPGKHFRKGELFVLVLDLEIVDSCLGLTTVCTLLALPLLITLHNTSVHPAWHVQDSQWLLSLCYAKAFMKDVRFFGDVPALIMI